MSYIYRLFFLTLTICIATAHGQTKSTDPHIGYLYPGGGRQGTTVTITVGGQYLRGITNVYVSGKGIHGSVIKYVRPTRNIQREQRELLQERMEEIKSQRLTEMTGRSSSNYIKLVKESEKRVAEKLKALKEKETDKKKEDEEKKEVKLPAHPLFESDSPGLSTISAERTVNTLSFSRTA